jgi:hypothetical protein
MMPTGIYIMSVVLGLLVVYALSGYSYARMVEKHCAERGEMTLLTGTKITCMVIK